MQLVGNFWELALLLIIGTAVIAADAFNVSPIVWTAFIIGLLVVIAAKQDEIHKAVTK